MQRFTSTASTDEKKRGLSGLFFKPPSLSYASRYFGDPQPQLTLSGQAVSEKALSQKSIGSILIRISYGLPIVISSFASGCCVILERSGSPLYDKLVNTRFLYILFALLHVDISALVAHFSLSSCVHSVHVCFRNINRYWSGDLSSVHDHMACSSSVYAPQILYFPNYSQATCRQI